MVLSARGSRDIVTEEEDHAVWNPAAENGERVVVVSVVVVCILSVGIILH